MYMATGAMRRGSCHGDTSAVGTTFGRIHEGLPPDSPWLFRVLLGSRAFLIATVVITVVFGAVTTSNPEWLLAVDEPVSEWFRGLIEDGGFATLVTHLGSPNLAVALGAIGVVALWRRCRASAITLALLVASAAVTDIVLKVIVNRPRPANPVVATALSSFPSGHVIHVVVMFGLIPILLWTVTNSRAYLKVGFAVFGVAVASVAVSRVALGVHWPSDVVASFFLGASLLLGAQSLIRSAWAADRCKTLDLHINHGISTS